MACAEDPVNKFCFFFFPSFSLHHFAFFKKNLYFSTRQQLEDIRTLIEKVRDEDSGDVSVANDSDGPEVRVASDSDGPEVAASVEPSAAAGSKLKKHTLLCTSTHHPQQNIEILKKIKRKKKP